MPDPNPAPPPPAPDDGAKARAGGELRQAPALTPALTPIERKRAALAALDAEWRKRREHLVTELLRRLTRQKRAPAYHPPTIGELARELLDQVKPPPPPRKGARRAR